MRGAWSAGWGWGSGKARVAMHVPIMSTTDIDGREGVHGIHLSPPDTINWVVWFGSGGG